MYVRLFHGQQLQRTLMTEYGILRVQLGNDRFYLTSNLSAKDISEAGGFNNENSSLTISKLLSSIG
jgi:hypothetical protein